MARTAILAGPTATGKSALALELAERHGGVELINADSLLVYREMEIGTAKPSREELARVPHHLIDLRSPGEPFTAGDFVRLARETISAIEARGKRAMIVGGTGFYLKALLYGLWEGPKADPALRTELEARPSRELYEELLKVDPESAYRISANDRYRLVRAMELIRMTGKTPTELQAQQPKEPDPGLELWVVDRADGELRDRIHRRTRAMLEAGLVEEVKALRAKYPGARALGSVGYLETSLYLDGKAPQGRPKMESVEDLASEIELATRQLVKRQRTWFRGEKASRWFVLESARPELEARFAELYGESR